MNAADYFLDRHVREGRGARLAVAGVGARLSYAELAERAGRVAGAWQELGVAPGDRVLLILPDSPELLACFFGTMKMGAIAVPVNPFTRAADYAHYAADCRPRLAVVHEGSLAEALPTLQQAKHPPRIFTVGNKAPGCTLLDDAITSASALPVARSPKPDDLAFFLYTSGSGGQPKAAMHRHQHMLATADCYARQVLGFHSDDVAFSASKLFFAYGLGNAGYFPLSVGAATVLLPERPTAERLFAVLEQYRPRLFFAVPTLYGALLRAAEASRQRLDFLRAAVSAGEALPVEIFQRFKKRFGLEILDGIGTTEMLHMFISNRPDEARPGSCGREVPGYRARIVTESGEEAKAGEIGHLWVAGPSRMAGYWEKPELSARVLCEAWYLTGDQFYRDPDGFFHYCGRADDMLKVSGMWVSPLEVENALLAHPAVAEAAVVGHRDPDGLTQVCAFIVLRSTASRPDPARSAEGEREGPAVSSLGDELRDFVRRRLPGYKVPARFEFVSDLPRTATGKIQRFKLRT
ncbi:MAG TPA: benzoate-CoA ligase family protein [Candidatus Xenobia bacterium]|nr:benzoate-CoA ligase family protein [Candidatus Xenobia bacterium]